MPPDSPSDFVCRCGSVNAAPLTRIANVAKEAAILDPVQAPVGDYFDSSQRTVRALLQVARRQTSRNQILSLDQFQPGVVPDYRYSVDTA